MYLRKESLNGRHEGNQNNQSIHSNNSNQLRTNLLSEDYGEAAFEDGQQNNNGHHLQNNRTSVSKREQNQNSSNNQISSNQRISNRDQSVELEQKQPIGSEKLKSFLDQLQQVEDNNSFNASINNLNQAEQILFSRNQNGNNEEGEVHNQDAQDQNDNQNSIDNEQTQKISIIYLKSLKQFLQGQQINLVYSLVKITVGSVVLILSANCSFSEYALWIFLLIAQSCISIIYNLRSMKKMKEPLFAEEIAIDLHQIEMFPIDSEPEDYVDYITVDEQIQEENEMNESSNMNQVQRGIRPLHQIPYRNFQTQDEDFRKVSMMVLQLKYECKKRDKIAMITGYTQFFFYLGLQIWAIVQFFIKENIFDSFYQNQDDCNINLLRFIFVVVLIGFFQYLDYYIILALIAICSIFIIAGLVYYLYKSCKKKRKRTNFIRKLKSIKYNKNQVREDQDCSICLNQFEESEKIIVLPCQAQHHFHDDCIKGWLKVNSTCPMCRTCFENYN